MNNTTIEVVLIDSAGIYAPIITTVSSDLPACVPVAKLMRGGFGQVLYYLTGAKDAAGRPIYGDPQ